MKQSILFLFFSSILLSNFVYPAFTIGRLNKEVINQCAHAIERKIEIDRYKLAAMLCLTAGLQLITLQRILQANSSSKVVEQNNTLSQTVDSALKSEGIVQQVQEGLSTSLQQLIHGAKNLFFTRDGLWGIAKFFGRIVGEASSYIVIQKAMRSLLYPDTLLWYVTSYVPYKTTISVMKEAVGQLNNENVHDIQKKYYPQLLADGCNQLVVCGQYLCAYMCYKGTQFPEQQKEMAIRAVTYMFDYHNRWLETMENQLNAEEPDYNKMLEMIDSYQTELKRHLIHFESLEAVGSQDN